MDVVLVVVGVLGLAVAALSARIKHLPLSEPLIGLAAGIVLGPAVLDVLPWSPVRTTGWVCPWCSSPWPSPVPGRPGRRRP